MINNPIGWMGMLVVGGLSIVVLVMVLNGRRIENFPKWVSPGFAVGLGLLAVGALVDRRWGYVVAFAPGSLLWDSPRSYGPVLPGRAPE